MSKVASQNGFRKAKGKNMLQRLPLRVSAAAATVVAAGIGLFMAPTPRAYALDDTPKVNGHITSIHFQDEVPGKLRADANGKLTYDLVRSVTNITEGWAEYGEDGKLVRLKVEIPFTVDGTKIVAWQNGKATVWFKDKKGMATVAEPNLGLMYGQLRQQFDPKLVMDRLKEAETKGKVKIVTQEGSEPQPLMPIVMIAQWSEPSDLREVYLVDRNTNLVEQVETFRMKGGNLVFTERKRFLDYNQPIPESVFTLNPPKEVVRMDQTTQEVGLPKGDLSYNEIGQKVAREFFEALVAKDYDKAGMLLEGMPGKALKDLAEKRKMQFLKIVSIGTPTSGLARQGGVRVPCQIEMEMSWPLGVRPISPQSRNWIVSDSDIVPKGELTRDDHTTQETGLPKGDLSDNEIAQKVAREFCEALISKDYATAGKLAGGIPAKKLQDSFEKEECFFVRLVSVGTPEPSLAAGKGGVTVACQMVVDNTSRLGVRPVYGRPDKWDIFSGF